MKIDLHTHTEYSHDSRLPIDKIVRIAKSRNLDGLAITDHNTFEGVKSIEGKEFKDFKIIKGEEITSDRGDILGLFIEEGVKSREYSKVIDEIKNQGGMVIIPHPFDKEKGEYFKNIGEIKDRIDGVEVFNGRAIYGGANDEAREFAEKNNLIKTAGSDSHTTFGIGKSYVEASATDIEDFREELENKNVRINGEKSNFLVHLISKFNSTVLDGF